MGRSGSVNTFPLQLFAFTINPVPIRYGNIDVLAAAACRGGVDKSARCAKRGIANGDTSSRL